MSPTNTCAQMLAAALSRVAHGGSDPDGLRGGWLNQAWCLRRRSVTRP